MKVETANCKHVFIDIVNYTKNRTVEAQVYIINNLNSIVSDVIDFHKILKRNILLLPTGDGMCITLLNSKEYDLHIRLALLLLERIALHNQENIDDNRKYTIRIGINENIDNIVTDINGKRNVAGAGINYAQRIMSTGDSNTIMIGVSVFEYLNQRDSYRGCFIPYETTVKHGERIPVYQYIERSKIYLNNNTPYIFQKRIEKTIPPTITDEFKYYLHILNKGEKIITEFVKEPGTHYYLFIALYYLAKDIKEYLEQNKKMVKNYSSNVFDCINENIINLSKALEIVTQRVSDISFAIDLSNSLIEQLIIKNNCSLYFKNKYEPYEINPDKIEEVNQIIESIEICNMIVK